VAFSRCSVVRVSRLLICLFGGLTVTLDGVPLIDLGYGKVRALLAVLACHRQGIERRKLAALLWPGLASSDATHRLRNALNVLRRSLGNASSMVESAGGALQLCTDEQQCLTDVFEFERIVSDLANRDVPDDGRLVLLERAAELTGGAFMQGIDIDSSVEFATWLHARRGTYHSQLLSLRGELTDRYLQAGHYDAALRISGQSLTLDPTNECAHRQVMTALARSGRPSSAIAQYHRCLSILAQDVGAAPHNDTTDLYHEISRGGLGGIGGPRCLDSVTLHPPQRIASAVMFAYFSPREQAGLEELTRVAVRFSAAVQAYDGVVLESRDSHAVACFHSTGVEYAASERAAKAARAVLTQHSILSSVSVRFGIWVGDVVTTFDDALFDHSGLGASSAARLALSALDGECVVEDARLVAFGFRLLDNRPRTIHQLHTTAAKAEILPPSSFIGRSKELDQLAALWREAKQGLTRCVLIDGELGIGKTRLVNEALRLIEDKFILARHECRSSGEPRLTAFNNMPSGAGHTPDASTTMAALSPWEQWLAVLDSSSPAIVVLDDLQHATSWQLEQIHRDVLKRCRYGVLLIALTRLTRPDLYVDWHHRMSLAGLAPVAVEELLRPILSTEDAVSPFPTLVAEVGGNPLLIHLLASVCQSDDPDQCEPQRALTALFHGLVAHVSISPQAAEVLQIASIFGTRFIARDVAFVAGTTLALAEVLLGQLVDAGVVGRDKSSNAFQFLNPTVQEAAYQSQPRWNRESRRRAAAHARALVVSERPSLPVTRTLTPPPPEWRSAEPGYGASVPPA